MREQELVRHRHHHVMIDKFGCARCGAHDGAKASCLRPIEGTLLIEASGVEPGPQLGSHSINNIGPD